MGTVTWDRTKTRQWARTRAAMLRQWGPHPTCWRCGQMITGAVVAGHVIDHARGGPATPDNLRPECLPCSRKSGYDLRKELARERNSSPNGGGISGKRIRGEKKIVAQNSDSVFSNPQGTGLGLPESLYPPGVAPDPGEHAPSAPELADDEEAAPILTPDAADPVWNTCPWLDELRCVPEDATWPRIMTGPHPDAAGSWGPALCEWIAEHDGTQLRWWQRLVAARILEHDAGGQLVWLAVLLSTSRQVGKSWLLRSLAMWRLHQSGRLGEQLVLHTGKDLPVCREVQRPARTWAKVHRGEGFSVRETNGQEEVMHPDGSRWIIRGRDSVYGYAATLGLVDEGWGVPGSVVDEGLEPTMAEREQAQLVITSTAHRRATSLVPSRRAAALAGLDSPADVLLVEWSAPPGADVADRDGWRAASPHWSARRERLVASKLARALSGEGDAEDLDDDPIAAFRSQWLNDWSIERAARLVGRDEPLTTAEDWVGAADLAVAPVLGLPLVIAVEDNLGHGAAVGFAQRQPDGRILAWGQTCPRRAQAALAATGMAERHPGSQLALPAPLRAAEGFPRPPLVAGIVDVGPRHTREALATLREVLAEGVLVHDGGDDLAGQVIAALVTPTAAGLILSSRCPRADLVRAVGWAVAALVAVPVPVEAPAIY